MALDARERAGHLGDVQREPSGRISAREVSTLRAHRTMTAQFANGFVSISSSAVGVATALPSQTAIQMAQSSCAERRLSTVRDMRGLGEVRLGLCGKFGGR